MALSCWKLPESRSNITLDETDSIVFSSVTAARENITSGGVQASVTAINANDERIQLNWIVSYTNLCEVLPRQFPRLDGICHRWKVSASS